MMITREQFRKLAIAILDDSQGTNGQAFAILHDFALLYQSEDIIKATQHTKGRFFLPEDHNLEES